MVARERDYDVDWRFISLRMINAHVDYDAHFPPGYEEGHTAGLKMLRVAAKLRAEQGREAVGPLYLAIGQRIFDTPPAEMASHAQGSPEFLEPILAELGLSENLLEALEDNGFDAEIRAETDGALALTGKDVGTPILQFQPPDGIAFFGPVISRLPSPEQAGELWDHVLGLASFPGFAELKRSLRELPQLASFGVGEDSVGVTEDWHGGSRRLKK
jgi:hypothetical protein